MPTDSLAELVSQLSPDEQAAVRAFIQFMRSRQEKSETSPFLAAVEEFMAEHPELLQRLAQ